MNRPLSISSASSNKTQASLSSRNASQKMSDYLQASLASNTRKAYQQDLQHFMQWGGRIPASPERLAAYLVQYALQLSIATLTRRVVAIGRAHTLKQLSNPAHSPLVKATLQGMRRLNGSAQRQVLPVSKQNLQRMLKDLAGLRGLRDKALLLIGFAAALRRSELVALQLTDIQFVKQGLVLRLRKSKTDQLGHGRTLAIPYARGRTCPVLALQEWLLQSNITEGSLFRRVDKHGQVLQAGLSAQSVALIVKARAQAAGLEAKNYSGHSLRAGLATCAAQAGVSAWKIRQQTGHQSDVMLQRYIRDSQLFKDNPNLKIW